MRSQMVWMALEFIKSGSYQHASIMLDDVVNHYDKWFKHFMDGDICVREYLQMIM